MRRVSPTESLRVIDIAQTGTVVPLGPTVRASSDSYACRRGAPPIGHPHVLAAPPVYGRCAAVIPANGRYVATRGWVSGWRTGEVGGRKVVGSTSPRVGGGRGIGGVIRTRRAASRCVTRGTESQETPSVLSTNAPPPDSPPSAARWLRQPGVAVVSCRTVWSASQRQVAGKEEKLMEGRGATARSKGGD